MGGGPIELLEREGEKAQIAALLDDVARSRGRALLIEGEAGIGKTRLLELTLDWAHDRGFGGQSAQGFELERSHPLGVVRQLLVPALAQLSADVRADVLSGAAAPASAVLEPPATSGEDPEPAALLHALYWLWANLAAEAPQVVCIDDAQWSDRSSLETVGFLARRLRHLPVLLVVTVRSGEPVEPVGVLDAVRDVVLAPQRLSAGASRAVLTRSLGDAVDRAFADACHEATGGNPFFLHTLVDAVSSDGIRPTAAEADRIRRLLPDTLARSVLVRLARLPADVRRVAQVVAVLGDRVPLAQLAAFLDVTEPDVADRCDRLAAAAILEAGPEVRFRHPVVRHAVYADVPAARRATDHARAADLLAREAAEPERIATHLLQASPARDPERVATLLRAGRRARARGAPHSAVTYLSRAAAEPPPPQSRSEVLRELGATEATLGAEAAVAHLEQAVAAAPDADARALAGRELVTALVIRGDAERAVEAATAISRVATSASFERALEVESALARTVGGCSRAVEQAILVRLDRVADRLDGSTPAQRELLAATAYLRTLEGRPRDEWAPLAELALDRGLAQDRGAETQALNNVAVALSNVENYGPIERALDDAIAHARRRGSVLAFVGASAMRANVAYIRGRLAEAEAEAAAALAAIDHSGLAGYRAWAAAMLVMSLTEQGRFDEAESVLAVNADRHGLHPQSRARSVLSHARARLWAATGRLEEALAELQAMLPHQPPGDTVVLGDTARLLAALGDRDEALRLVRAAPARTAGKPRLLGAALRDLGVVTGGEEGLRLLEQSVALLEGTEGRRELVRALLDWGSALRRANQRAQARRVLQRALEAATQIGAGAFADKAREELLVAGARPRRERFAGPASLTASERRVAEMAAAGMSNREIAQALFVTMKTVEFHLTQTYRKLDVASRADLAGALEWDGRRAGDGSLVPAAS